MLVDDIDGIYQQTQQAHADIARPITTYSWHVRQFWLRRPDGYLLRSAQWLM